MTAPTTVLPEIRAALEPHGIFTRGVADFSGRGGGPTLHGGGSAASVVLLGNIGGSIWQSFDHWRQLAENRDRTDPLDDWSKELIAPLAETLGATAYFPSEPPWQPFQQWATMAEGLIASPLGILIHSEYGLWHGYRGALGFEDRIDHAPAAVHAPHPCDECAEKPCLRTCPVDAVTELGFSVARCRSHLPTEEGKAGCMQSGCLARAACPVGAAHSYPPAQLRFHMEALWI
ncbi:4Fe-4S dicluster domain-containing protein [Rhizobium sp. BK251]|uniref:4Fe-4S dicluster domain-containing protein n=1 Tax=Rhizobium sp. BK251 TaxID=2512125 RepID=UPI001050AF42|nr:4Fe-4S dicluster domain-containing protein [Rhizobium sp. BK251]TCL73870.1 ferredoxin [Rhizobium sp. BK251]